MDFRQLSYLTAIAKYRNITKAADSLYVGQSTLSKFLSSLEAELGLKLFRRTGNTYELTYAGERYLEKASQILLLKEDLDAEMADILKRDRGVLNVSFAKMRCSYMLPRTLPVFHKKYPNVRVSILEGSSAENDRRLLEGQADAAFYSKPSETNPLIEYHTLAQEELLICTCRNHPIKQHAVYEPGRRYPYLELEDLTEELVLMMNPEQRTRQIVDSILRSNKVRLNNVMYISNIQAIMGLAASGYGISFVFDTHLNNRAETLPIDCYSIGKKGVTGDFVAAVRKGSYISNYTREFIQIVRDAIGGDPG